MAKVKPKTQKVLIKQLGKLLKKHGPEFAMGIATGIVTNLLTADAEKKAKKSMAGRAKKGTGKKATRKKNATAKSKK